ESGTSKKRYKVTIVLPDEVLPSKEEMPIGFFNQSYTPDDIHGFQSDMNPKLRETLETLEDDAYIENDLMMLLTLKNYLKNKRIMKKKRLKRFRCAKLRLLDDQFEKIEKEFMEDNDNDSDIESTSSSQDRKIVPKSEDTVQNQLEAIRQELRQVHLNEQGSELKEEMVYKATKTSKEYVEVESELFTKI
ncbi:18014_t:CDS:2, partial [Racocetra persica]